MRAGMRAPVPIPYLLPSAIGMCVLFFGPTHAWSLGLDVVGTAPCEIIAQDISGSFSSEGAHYVATGTCTTLGSLGVQRTFPYIAKGAYVGNTAKEVVEITPPLISQPSHPSGKWQTIYSCPSDPWLTPDGPPFDPVNPQLKCRIVSRHDQSTGDFGPRKYQDGRPLPTLTEVFDEWRAQKPLTSVALMPAQRSALSAKRDQDLKAEAIARADKRLRAGVQQQGTISASLSPIIVAPAVGQRFLNQSPVPIKLAPPPPWADTEARLDGTPIKTAKSVTMYMVKIERKDAKGNWIAHATFPVGAVQAESVEGFTGFGAGAPPAYLSMPGAWRLRAQVMAPQQSGWSDWIAFSVMAPAGKNAFAPIRGFSK